MSRFRFVFMLSFFFLPQTVFAAESADLNIRTSTFDFETTLERVQAEIEARGATIVATVRHSTAAQSVGLTLRPTAVVIFGNPRLGTQLMQRNQEVGIDLPLRILVWEGESGEVLIGYRPGDAITGAHGIEAAELSDTMNAALDGIASAASG